MSRIQIINQQDKAANSGAYATGAFTGFGTVVKLDGQEIRSLRALTLRVNCDEVVNAQLEVFADDLLDIDIGAEVEIRLIVIDDSLEMEETPLPDGRRRFRVVRKAE